MSEFLIEDKIRSFLAEDIGFEDVTTESVVDEKTQAVAIITCNERAVLAGLKEASKVFEILGCKVKLLKDDGALVEAGTRIMEIDGYGKNILKGERVALNLLMRMTGIATATYRIISKAKKVNPKVRIACTRKTVPGLRYFDKKAVMLGGGDTHRLRLDDCVLIKDNHIKLVGSVKECVKRVRKNVSFTKKIEVEVENLNQAIEAAEAEADIIMLDNMKPNEISLILEELRKRGMRDKILVECSGRINEENIEDYVRTGVDIISIGALTHSVKSVDMSLEIKEIKKT